MTAVSSAQAVCLPLKYPLYPSYKLRKEKIQTQNRTLWNSIANFSKNIHKVPIQTHCYPSKNRLLIPTIRSLIQGLPCRKTY